MVPGQAKQFTHQAGGNVGFVWVYVGFVWVCIENTAASVERDVGKTRDVSFPFPFRAVCVLPKRKKQKARPKGVNLKVRWRAKVAMR